MGRFDDQSGCDVSGGMVSFDPVGCKSELGIYGLFKGELSAGTIMRIHNTGAGDPPGPNTNTWPTAIR